MSDIAADPDLIESVFIFLKKNGKIATANSLAVEAGLDVSKIKTKKVSDLLDIYKK